MLSIGPMSGGQGRYYLQLASEDYYLDGGEPQGRWYGEGAKALKLGGQVVTGNALHSLLSGFSPGGEKLVQNAGNDTNKTRRPGFDFTFSAPKSVSALWAVAPEDVRRKIQECQDAAVKAALDYIQAEAAFARTGKGGATWHKAGLTVALFEHGTSRALDPQLHTHALVINLGHFGERFAALVHTKLFDVKMAAGALYRVELAHLLEKTLGVTTALDATAYRRGGLGFRIDGVVQSLCDHWSKRRDAIEKELGVHGAESAVAAAIAAKETREVKEVIPPRSELFRRWQAEAQSLGLTAQALADVFLRKDSATQSMANIIRQTTKELTDTPGFDRQKGERAFGLSHFTERELFHRVIENAQCAGLDATSVRRQFAETMKKPDSVGLVELGSDKLGVRHFTTPAIIALEKEILSEAKKLKRREGQGVADKKIDKAIEKAFEDLERSDQQEKAIRYLASTKYGGLRCLEGWAGAGKTTVMKTVAELYADAGYKVIGTAVAGRAALGLATTAKIETFMTLATLELLTNDTFAKKWMHHGAQVLKAAAFKLTNGQLRFPLYQYRPLKLDSKTVVICDEASMVETKQMKMLIDRVNAGGALLILTGDRKQVQAIGLGGTFGELTDRCGTVGISKIIRQRDERDRQAVKDIAEGNPEKAIKSFAERGLLNIEKNRDAACRKLADDWLRYECGQAKADSLIFVSTNEERRTINRLCQEGRLRAGELDRGQSVTVSGETFYRYDRVLLGKNWKAMNVCNGDIGTIIAILPGRSITVQLDGDRTVTLPLRSYDSISSGYAVTTHKGQGATVERSYVLAGGCMQDREISYVQASRARQETRLYASQEEVGEQNKDLIRQMQRSQEKTMAYTLTQTLEKRL